MKQFKFKVGDRVKHKGFASGDGKGAKLIIIEQLEEEKLPWLKEKSLNYNYIVKFIHTEGTQWDAWNKSAEEGTTCKEWEDMLEIDNAYNKPQFNHSNIASQLKQLGI